MKKFCLLFINIVFIFPCSLVAEARPLIKIGVIAPLAGPSAAIGNEVNRTLNLLEKEHKSKPSKYFFQFIFEDGKAGVDSAPTTTVTKLTSIEGVKFFIVATSSEIMQVASLADRQDLLMIATYATAPDIKKLGDRIFRTSIDVERGLDSLNSYLLKTGDLPLALFTEEHTFTSGISESIRNKLSDHIVADETYRLDDNDLRSILVRARAKHPKAYYFSCARPNTCAQITNQARQLGITEQFYSFLHMSDPDFLNATPSSSNGFRFLATPDTFSQSPEFDKFKALYLEKYSGSPKIDFLMRSTYDAANALISGIEKVGPSPVAVSRYFQSYKTLGALGLISFDSNGDIQNLNYEIKEVVDGKVRPIQ